MADCFSLPNDAAYEKIKTPFAKICVGGDEKKPCFSIVWYENKKLNIGYSSYCLSFVFQWLRDCFEVSGGDIDFIEALLAENEKLKAERDTAVGDIPRTCWTCKWNKSKERCNNCNRLLQYFPAWEWKGVQKD